MPFHPRRGVSVKIMSWMNANYEIDLGERPLDEEERRAYARQEAKQWLQIQTVDWLLHLAPWDCFLTCTFKVRIPSADTGRQVFVNWWKERWHGVPCFYAVELHPGGHGAHIHGLMALKRQRIQRTALWESWFNVFGRCSFLPPRSVDAVAGYCAGGSVLEVMKDGCWGILGVTQNSRKLRHVLRREIPAACSAARSSEDSRPVDAGIEEKKIEQVDLWDRPHLAVL